MDHVGMVACWQVGFSKLVPASWFLNLPHSQNQRMLMQVYAKLLSARLSINTFFIQLAISNSARLKSILPKTKLKLRYLGMFKGI